MTEIIKAVPIAAESARHRSVLARLEAGEPVRVVIGHYDFDMAGILLATDYQERLRADLAAGIRALIAALENPEPPEGPAPISPPVGEMSAKPTEGGAVPPTSPRVDEGRPTLPPLSCRTSPPQVGEIGSVAAAPAAGAR